MAELTLRRNFLDSRSEVSTIESSTVFELLESLKIPADLYKYIYIKINDLECDDWSETFTNYDTVFVGVIPGGSSNETKSAIASVLIIALSIYTFNPTLAWGFTATSGLTGGSLVAAQMGIIFVGSMAINAMFKPSMPSAPRISTADSYGFHGLNGISNQVRYHGAVRSIYGFLKVAPDVAVEPLRTTAGTAQTVRLIYDFGYGDVELTDLRFNNAPIATVAGLTYAIHRNYMNGPLTIYDFDATTDNPNHELTATPFIFTAPNVPTSTLILTFSLPQGLYDARSGTSIIGAWLGLNVMYRAIGSSTWLPFYDQNITQSSIRPMANFFPSGAIERDISPDGLTQRARVRDTNNLVGLYAADERGTFGHQLAIGDRFIYDGIVRTVVTVNINAILSYATFTPAVTGATWSPYYPVSKNINDYVYGLYFYTYTQPVNITFNRDIRNSFSIEFSRDVPLAQYEFNISKGINPGSPNPQLADRVILESVTAMSKAAPLNFRVPHTIMEMQLTASTAVGSVDKITALASRHIDTYSFDGTNYIPEVKASSNPSWIALDLLTGDSNPKPLTMNRVDLRSFYEFSQYCDTVKHGSPRFACNFTWDADSTVLQRVQEVLLSARASITIRNNKYAVVWEQYPTAAVQRFTPDNTWGYSSVLTFPEVPDALRVSFIDPSIDYQMNDLDVYNDGITAVTARTFERITLPLCTNKAQAWRSGRYYLRQGIVRREVVSIQTDVENLICERGDRVHLSSDIVNPFSNHWQQLTVATVTAGSLTFTPTAITNLVGGADILLKYDDHHGQVVTTSHLGSFVDATTTINHPDITVADFLVGSTIYAINEAALADIHYLVKSITPSADLTATLTLVPLKRAELIGIDDENLPTFT